MERNSANRFPIYPVAICAVLAVLLTIGSEFFLVVPYFDEHSEIRTTLNMVVVIWVSLLLPVRSPKGREIRGVGAEPDPNATWVRSFPGSVLLLALVVSFFAHRWLGTQGLHPVLEGTLAALPAIVLLCAPRYRAATKPTARATS